MTTEDSDPRLTRRYQELARAEPPARLDAAILGAAREAAQPRLRRWYVPVSVAAVVMLSVTVALQLQIDPANMQSEIAAVPPPRIPEELFKTAKPAEAPKAAEARKALPRVERKREQAAETRSARDEPVQFAASPEAPPPPAAKPAPAPARADAAREAPQASARSIGAVAGARALSFEEDPARWLEQIAELRRQGKHDEADKALAEFRKRYPQYRLSEEMRLKVEKQ